MGSGKAAGAVPVVLHLVQDHHRRGHAPPSLPPPAGSDGGGSQARPRVMMVENSPRSATFDQAGACQNGVAASDRRGCTPLHARRAGHRPGRIYARPNMTPAQSRAELLPARGGETMKLPDSMKRHGAPVHPHDRTAPNRRARHDP